MDWGNIVQVLELLLPFKFDSVWLLLLAAENAGQFILGNTTEPYLYAILAAAAASIHETLASPGSGLTPQ